MELSPRSECAYQPGGGFTSSPHTGTGTVVRCVRTSVANTGNPIAALFDALSSNAKVRVIRDLLASKASVEYNDPDGNTPLLVATRHNHLLGAALLLAKKADVEACNSRGLSSPFLATMNAGGKHGALIDKLLSTKADVNRRNAQGKTPLMMAAYHRSRNCRQQTRM